MKVQIKVPKIATLRNILIGIYILIILGISASARAADVNLPKFFDLRISEAVE